MIRNFRLGVAVLAVLALTAVGASAAQAASSLDVGAAPALLEGTQVTTNKLEIKNSKSETLSTVKCTVATLSGTSTSLNVTSQLVTPNYGTECTLGGTAAKVEVNKCQYRLNSTATAKTASADVVCETGKKIEIIQGACVITINTGMGENTGLSSVTFANEGSGSTANILATLNVSKIALTGGASCPANLVGGANTGTLTGTIRVNAFKDESGKGAQVSLSAT